MSGYKPDIGEYCEVFLTCNALGDRWARVKCVGYDAEGIIWRNGSDTQSYLYANLEDVRKHRSEYEIFEEELTELFDNDKHIPYNLNSADYEVLIKLLYDNGYRKENL